MAWMIYLAKEKDIGTGCKDCKFLNNLKVTPECIADENVDVFINSEISEYRPYCCPFRYYSESVPQITKRLSGLTEAETAGWFKGADFQVRHYIRLEEERNRFVKYLRKNDGL